MSSGGSKRKPEPAAAGDECAICLLTIDDRAMSDACTHTFCYICLLQWSLVTPSCPLCKTPFDSIIHSIVSPQEFKRYFVRRREKPPTSSTTTTSNGSSATTTTTAATSSSDDAALAFRRAIYVRGFRARAFIHGQASERHALPGATRSEHSVYWGDTASDDERQARLRRCALALRFASSAERARLAPWLRRDIRAITQLDDVLVVERFVSDVVYGSACLLDDEAALDQLASFLYAHTRAFVHELLCFAASPFSVAQYDQLVCYERPVDRAAAGVASTDAIEAAARADDAADAVEWSTQDSGSGAAAPLFISDDDIKQRLARIERAFETRLLEKRARKEEEERERKGAADDD